MNGQADTRPEQRRFPRIDATFMVGYRIENVTNCYYIGESCNAGQGGMLVTTATRIKPGCRLAMQVRFPFMSRASRVTGKVAASREILRGLIYKTGTKFIDLDTDVFKMLGDYVAASSAENTGHTSGLDSPYWLYLESIVLRSPPSDRHSLPPNPILVGTERPGRHSGQGWLEGLADLPERVCVLR